MSGYFFVLFFLSTYVLKDVYCNILRDINVPSMVIIDGSENKPITLDCDYDSIDESLSLVVKWFKNNEVVYQWIRGQEPSIFPAFKDKVESILESSTDSDHGRKLVLLNPNISTSGLYRCTVQTAKETMSMEKTLQIVDISNHTISFNHNKVHNETHLECTVDNVYPEPFMNLTTNDDDDIIKIISFNINEDNNQLFNATIVAVVDENEDDDESMNDDIDTYKCIVGFLGTPLKLSSTITSGAEEMDLLLYPFGLLFVFLFRNF